MPRQWKIWAGRATEAGKWDSVLNHWYRLRTMEESRANFKVFKWAVENGNNRCKKWCFRLKQHKLSDLYFDIRSNLVYKDYVKQTIDQNIHNEYK